MPLFCGPSLPLNLLIPEVLGPGLSGLPPRLHTRRALPLLPIPTAAYAALWSTMARARALRTLELSAGLLLLTPKFRPYSAATSSRASWSFTTSVGILAASPTTWCPRLLFYVCASDGTSGNATTFRPLLRLARACCPHLRLALLRPPRQRRLLQVPPRRLRPQSSR